MKQSIFIKIWLPISLVLFAILMLDIIVFKSRVFVFALTTQWIMIGIQIIDIKYKLKILN